MANLRNNQRSVRFTGAGMLPRMTAATDGVILSQVVDWPWASDSLGVPFDQSAIYGVRTRATGGGASGADEADFLVAVPRILPAGYDPRGRCSGDLMPIISDQIGADPMTGCSPYNYGYGFFPVYRRTASSGAYPVGGTDWVPMNLNRNALTPTTFGGFGFWATDGSIYLSAAGFNDPPYAPKPPVSGTVPLNFYGASLGQHVGFRGGQLTVSYRGGSAPPYTWSGFTKVRVGYSATPISAPSFGTVIFESEWYKTEADYVGFSDGYHNFSPKILSLPPMLPAPTDRQPYWYMFFSYASMGQNTPGVVDGGFGSAYPSGFQFSPRTDIPLWFSSTTGNKIAPGGVLP